MKHLQKHILFYTVICCLVFMFTACGSGSANPGLSPTTASSQRSPIGESTGTTPTPNTPPNQTQPMPPTQTSCPSPVYESGRAAVLRPLAQGNDPSIAYINNTGTQERPITAELKLYDVSKGIKTVITHLPDDYITEAQVSSDGQWILFVTNYPKYAALQLVRMDGKGLQTLYCTTRDGIQGVQWSPDQSQVVFSVRAVSGLLDVYLLKLSSGQLQPELVQLNSANPGYLPRTWEDNTHVYITGVLASLQPPTNQTGLYLLDTSKGPNQSPKNLQTVIPANSQSECWDFDSDYHATTLVASRCNGTFSYNNIRAGDLLGPSSIVKGPVTGGQFQKIYQNNSAAITQVRFLGYSSSQVLFTVNTVSLGVPGVPVDSSHNGLWKMDIDGSVTKLASENAGYLCELNLYSQYPWANVSRSDGALYALQVSSLGNGTTPPTFLEYGSINGSGLKSFASVNEFSGSLAIAGWTTM
ncbi:MAG TPA: hypothetical protein VEI53_06645 [Ktedonobacteraceae bacterium]|nr:hypothetical protein [Ktedonobacteraceae bacterium]